MAYLGLDFEYAMPRFVGPVDIFRASTAAISPADRRDIGIQNADRQIGSQHKRYQA